MAFCASVRAEMIADPSISFSGFGTLGVVHSTERKADFSTSFFKPGGAGHSQNWSPDIDSLLAGQIDANLGPNLTGVLQVISEQQYDGSYRPGVEWANLKYQFTPDFFVRVGRVVMPSFLLSASRKVSYANPWLRPPIEVYNLVPVTKNDGLDMSYRIQNQALIQTFQFLYGSIKPTFPDGSIVIARNQMGLYSTTEYDALTLRLAYHQAHLEMEGPHSFFELFSMFGPQGLSIADQYDCHGKLVRFGSIGISYEPGKWFVMSEWARNKGSCFVGTIHAWYVSAGRRFGTLTPYLTYADTRPLTATSDPGLNLSNLPPQLAGPAAGMNVALNNILGAIASHKTISLGTRWDFASNAALKLQFDHTRIGAGSVGPLRNLQPGFQPGGKVNLFSAAVDFVF